MPPARTPTRPGARTGAGKPPAGGKPPTDGRSRFSRAFRRFRGGGPRPASGRRAGSLTELLRDVRNALRKVEWPTREEGIKLTAAVVGLSAVVGIFLGGVDFVFQELFKFLIEHVNGV